MTFEMQSCKRFGHAEKSHYMHSAVIDTGCKHMGACYYLQQQKAIRQTIASASEDLEKVQTRQVQQVPERSVW